MRKSLKPLYQSRQWQKTKRAVKRRDKYRCTACGRAGRLEIHHLKPAWKYPELFFSLDNLTALCRQCHLDLTRQEQEAELPPQQKAWRQAIRELL